MKVLFVVILISLISEVYAQQHQPTWFLMDDRSMSSFDMLTTRSGLIAIDDNGVRVLSKYDNGAINGVFALNGPATSIIISDQNVAYVAVKGDGIYVSSNQWKDYTLILQNPNPYLLAVSGQNILANLGGIFYYSNDASGFHQAGGISPGDTIVAAEIFSSQTAIAVTAKKIYRSRDGGRNWNVVLDTLSNASSIYLDHSNAVIYVGSKRLMKSLDSGLTWKAISNIFFTLSGPVVGARDCSGNFYIAPDAATHGSLYRSVDQGRFFQEAGPAIFSSTAMHKGVVLDRGSTFFWLDESGLIGVVRDGIDSTLTDSVSDRIIITADSGIHNSLCNNAPPTQFSIAVSYDQCTGIILDSLKQVKVNSLFSSTFTPGFLGNSSPANFPFTYHATHTGFDTAHYRLRFHSATTGNIEEKYFDIIALGTAGSPDISFTPNELDFKSIGLDSIRKISVSISNSGCDSLFIDTIYSTNPAIFIPDPRKFSIHIAPGKSINQVVSFNPHLAGDYLESLSIETNIGSRFITLRGTGNAPIQSGIESSSPPAIAIYPNPANEFLIISSVNVLPKTITMRDVLGRSVTRLFTNNSTSITCDLSVFPDGSYIVDFGGNMFERIVIEH